MTDFEKNLMIREICEKYPKTYPQIIKKTINVELLDYIMENSVILDASSTIGKRINFVLSGLKDFPKCKICGNPVIGRKDLKWDDTWPTYCSIKCLNKDVKTITNKIQNTKLLKYGDKNYNGDKEELKRNNKKKYGCDWYFQTKEFKEKTQETFLKRGYDHPMHSIISKNKLKETCRQKYGVDYSCLSYEVMNNAKKKYFYHETYFDSSWEMAMFIYLEDNKIDFKYHPNIIFKYLDDNGNTHNYCPDFSIKKELYEIKGNQFLKDNGEYHNPYDSSNKTDNIYESKHQCMLNNHINILTKTDIEKYLVYCKNKFKDNNWKNRFRIDKKLEIELDNNKLRRELIYYRDKILDDKFPCYYPPRNEIVKYFQQDTFFRYEKEIWNKDSQKRNRLIQNREKYLNKTFEELDADDILSGFKRSGMYYGYSHFNPLWFKWFNEKFNVKTCYDPCGGWGHRLLGALNIEKYIYNDLSKTTKENVDRIIEHFGLKNIETHNEDARDFVPVCDFDAMFTCPPYFNVEHYECGDFKDMNEYDAFVDALFDVFKRKESCKIFGLVIREDLLNERHQDFSFSIPIMKPKEKYLNKIVNKQQEKLYVFCELPRT